MRIRKPILRLAQATLLGIIGIPLLWLLLSVLEPEVILFQAWRIAGNRPYCIAVPSDYPSPYRQAVKRGDLTYSALTTEVDWAGSGSPKAMNYYAILVLKNPNELRNWSKFYLNFESDVVPMQGSIVDTNFNKLCPAIVNFTKSVRWPQ